MFVEWKSKIAENAGFQAQNVGLMKIVPAERTSLPTPSAFRSAPTWGIRYSSGRLLISLPFFIASAIFIAFFVETPRIGILLADATLCLLLAISIRSRFSGLFLLHPALILFSSILFSEPFTSLGDGEAYDAVVKQYIDTSTGTLILTSWVFENDIFSVLKTASFGILPTIFIPEYIFGSSDHEVYYLWQATFHTALVSVAVTLARVWRALDMRHLTPIALYSVMGPSFFDLGATPTRHFVTYFGMLLFLVSYLAIRNRFSLGRALGMTSAISVILLSKAVLIGLVLVFVLTDQFLLSRKQKKATSLLFKGVAIAGVLASWGFMVEKSQQYSSGIATEGAATFGYLANIPLVGIVFKFIFALLSPFPWRKAGFFIETTYGGNWLLFLSHVGSSLFGTYLFVLLLLRWRSLLRHPNVELRIILLFGVVMSLSILGGATGFHTYLLIYFPFLSTVLAWPKLKIPALLPFTFVAFVEASMLVVG